QRFSSRHQHAREQRAAVLVIWGVGCCRQPIYGVLSRRFPAISERPPCLWPMSEETIAIASDHAGFDLKGAVKTELEAMGHTVLALGTHGPESVDYPMFADALAAALRDGRAGRGVLVCGTGIGISIAANRHRHVRAALCHDSASAR